MDISNHRNLSWHGSLVSRHDRAKITGTCGKVIWLTGLSGSGKSTIAINAERELIRNGILACCIDGDDIRKRLNYNLGFSIEDRAEHIRRVAVIASLFRDSGTIALVSVISPLASMRAAAAEIIGKDSFYEIYVKANIETCSIRDPKGLYKRENAGEIKMFTGISSDYEPPVNPALILDTEKYDVTECTARLLRFISGLNE